MKLMPISPSRVTRWTSSAGLRRSLRLAAALSAAAAVLALAVLAAGAMVVSSAVAPRNKPIGEPPAGAGLVEVPFDSAAGHQLSAWAHLPGTTPTFVAVLGHPVGGSRRAMLERAEWYRARGGAAFLFDFRGHGHSDAAQLTFGLLEASDLTAAVQKARERWAGRPIVVDGWSLGAAAALMAGERLDVDALVLEAPYVDLRSAVRDRADLRLPFGAGLAADLLLLHAPWALGVEADRIRPIDGAPSIAVPTLLLAGDVDRRAPLDGVRSIAERLPDSRGVVVFEGAAHADLFAHDPQRFGEAVGAFLDGVVRSSRVAERPSIRD